MARLTAPAATAAFTAALLLALVNCDASPTVPVERPFHGTTAGHLVSNGPAPAGRCPTDMPLYNTYHGSGEATEMGAISVDGGECIFAVPGHPEQARSGAGLFTFAAANGDTITVAYDQTTGSYDPSSPWLLWSAPISLVAGTGRFKAARLVGVTWHGGMNRQTKETWSEFDGKIVY